ncbi:PTS mannose/fructose/sorbose transporter subunit IIB, partial [Enterococcus faecium]|nr:PTS mannose/fructose/sorbose transporter subunit IIB [Enterococcus faecium]
PPSEDKKTLSKEVMLTTSEIQDLKELVELYPDTVFQPTPAMEKRSAISILSDF